MINGLLIDTMPLTYQVLTEDTDRGQKIYRLSGDLSEGDVLNRNDRIYPTNLLKRELDRLIEDIKSRRIIGELDHPEDLKIHLERVSHLICEAHFEGNKIIGTIEIIPETDAGRNLLGLVKAGVNLGISSRAMGSLSPNQEGHQIVQEDLKILTWDIVAQPSNYGSWLQLVEEFNRKYNKKNNLEDLLNTKLRRNKDEYWFS